MMVLALRRPVDRGPEDTRDKKEALNKVPAAKTPRIFDRSPTRHFSEPVRHKVLRRGGPGAESTRTLLRPRAEAPSPVVGLCS
jgi:hypothetical protein